MDLATVNIKLKGVEVKVHGEPSFSIFERDITDLLSVELQQHEIHHQLHNLRKVLLPSWSEQDSPEAQLASYRDLLDRRFEDVDSKATLSDLEQTFQYAEWRRTKNPCVLRISGYTTTKLTDLCWLSHLIPSLVNKLQLEQQPLAFYLAQRKNYAQEEVPIRDIVANIVFQLLQLKTHAWDRKRFDELTSLLATDDWSENLQSLCQTLVTVLEGIEPTTLILDRVDHATCIGKAPRFVQRLLEALSASTCNAKILLVTSSTSKLDWDLDISDDMKKNLYLEIKDWDQAQATTPRRRRRQFS